jgi:hypothetical protein
MHNRKDTLSNINHSFQSRPETLNLHHREEIIDGFSIWIDEYITDGWDGYFFAFMFNQLRGKQDLQLAQISRGNHGGLYRKLVTRVVRKPNSPEKLDLLPRAVFFSDRMGAAKQLHCLRDVSVNDGLHMHGVFVLPSTSRLKVGLDEHFREHRSLYETPKLYRIDVRPITHDPDRVVQYAAKALKTRLFTEDDVLILPESTGEHARETPATSAEARKIRDIQSRRLE